MKKHILFLAAILVFFVGHSQKTYTWPIAGMTAGENIIFQPQSYLDGQLVYDDLIIKAAKGTLVVAPTNGKITFYNYTYQNNRQSQTTFALPVDDWRKDSLDFAKQMVTDIQHVNLTLAIQTQDGKTIWISGLRPYKKITTGENIRIGDTIGLVGYYYKAIKYPCICINISERNKSVDPMSPFGLPTTFKTTVFERPKTLSIAQAVEDFSILIEALQEGFPGLYDYITENDFNNLVKSQLDSFTNIVSIEDFENSVMAVICKIKDGHTVLQNPYDEHPMMVTVAISYIDGNLIVTRTTPLDAQYYGRTIKTVDGIECDSLIAMVSDYLYHFDGYNMSGVENQLATLLDIRYCRYCQDKKRNHDLTIVFDDGEKKTFKGESINQSKCINLKPSWRDWYVINRRDLIMKSIDDSTAYIGIPTFDLDDVQVGKIAEFIRQISSDNVANLIIDLRNNSGGDEAVLNKIFSFIAQNEFRQTMYSMVTKKGDYDFFIHSTNHIIGDTLFADYKLDENLSFYVKDHGNEWCYPDTTSNYSNKVYLISNEWSLSAASAFAGLVKKHNRGAIVGRETGSAYHQMKALRFEKLLLPNSAYIVAFPLVKVVIDTVVNEKFPYGRGVLPDYPVAISLDELESSNGDKLLNYTLELIADNKYINPSDTETIIAQTADNEPSIFKTWRFWIIITVFVLIIIFLILCK